jgi:hypothetical protein
MNIKITGTVKIGGKWRRPGEGIKDVSDEIGQSLIAQGVAAELPESKAEDEAEAAAKAAVAAAKEAEKQLKALRKKAAELGIEGAAEKDADTLTAEIAEAEKK